MRINIHDLRERLKSTGVNQSALAKAIGVSASAISHYMKGSYPGDVPGLEAKIADWIKLHQDRAATTSAELPTSIVKTDALTNIHRVLRIVERACEMGLITGRSGVGKTTALREYKREHPALILIEADHGYTARALFLELCEVLNLDTKGSLHDMLGRVVTKLEGSGRLIAVDEAEHLPYRALELLRRVHDKAGVGICLVGMPRLKTNLQGNPNHYEQLYSRIGAFRKVDELNDSDIEALAVSRLGPVDSATLGVLRTACKKNARVLVKLARWCLELSRINHVEISPDVVREASDLCVIS